MLAIADAIGVRAPSLYKRFPHRAALLTAVEQRAFGELSGVLQSAARGRSAAGKLRAMGRAYRRFARSRPRVYALLFSGATLGEPEATVARQNAAAPAIHAFEQLIGKKSALAATRVFTAFLHGFVSMETAGEFRLGPEIDKAFELGLRTVIPGGR